MDNEIFDDSIIADFEKSFFRQPGTTNSASSSNNLSALNLSALCCDEEISGYDKLTGKTWIYPTNYPVRDYQFNIIQAALLKNTLVSLPTGLGKTFIAAVIMNNFYRWYPCGKIIFVAPTKPLVAQQVEACYNIVAIPPRDTITLTSEVSSDKRKEPWRTKRVFFATPHVILNDIKQGICPGDKIRCLVIDEAHRARGKYEYCQIISALTEMKHNMYRILALSATPGSTVEDVKKVVTNLHIAHLELRTENCIDVAKYSHQRKIHIEKVPVGPELTHIRNEYIQILDRYARRLKHLNILPENLGNLSKGRIVMLYKGFQTKDRGSRHPQHNYIMKDFTLLISLYHGLELLVKHGSRVFLNFFDEHPEKSWMQSDDSLTALLERLRDDLGDNPLPLVGSVLPDGTLPEIKHAQIKHGHPKFDKMKEIILKHFNKAKQEAIDTRAIVFCEYQNTVDLVLSVLLACSPLIKPQKFVGQKSSGKSGKTMTQAEQLRAMRQFRAGASNTLVCTCVAEEGLDVGSVDLIVCFDVSTRSPVRLVQRCGRTGRERGGEVFILVTEGSEHQTLLDSMRQRDGLCSKVLQSKEVQNSLYKYNPRMIPRDFTPECQKMFITVKEKDSNDKRKESNKKPKKGQQDIHQLFSRGSTSRSSLSKNVQSHWISKEDFEQIYPNGYVDCDSLFPRLIEYWPMSKDEFKKNTRESALINLSSCIEQQRYLHRTQFIQHSKDSEILVSILKECAEQEHLPCSVPSQVLNQNLNQHRKILSPAKRKLNQKKPKIPIIKSPVKSHNIRTLFSAATNDMKNCMKLLKELKLSYDKRCLICEKLCNCKIIQNITSNKNPKPVLMTIKGQSHLPDIDLIDHINLETIHKSIEMNSDIDINYVTSTENDDITLKLENDKNSNFDLQIDVDAIPAVNSTLDKPLTDSRVIKTASELDKNRSNNFDLQIDLVELISPTEDKKTFQTNDTYSTDTHAANTVLDLRNTSKNFNLQIDLDALNLLVKESNTDEPSENERVSSHQMSPSILSGRSHKKSGNLRLSTKNETPNTSSVLNRSARKQNISEELSDTPADESMYTIDRLISKINKDDRTDDSTTIISIDSSDDDTIEYDMTMNTNRKQSEPNVGDDSKKRKIEDDLIIASPYFNKKPKLNNDNEILAPFTSRVYGSSTDTNNYQVNFMINTPKPFVQKENKRPVLIKTSPEHNHDGSELKKTLETLQMFRRNSQLTPKRNALKDSTNLIDNTTPGGLTINESSSDDDFVNDTPKKNRNKEDKKKKYHKTVTKRKKANPFIEREAEVSDDYISGSGDELSDGSLGSLRGFIDDDLDPDEHAHHHTMYLRSIKSPVFGNFKIPQVPQKYNKSEILSQYVADDTYEMDSFCVDSHVGLTQVNEVSELELAEMLLEESRRAKKSLKKNQKSDRGNDESPIIRRKPTNNKRQINSDSEDSS